MLHINPFANENVNPTENQQTLTADHKLANAQFFYSSTICLGKVFEGAKSAITQYL